MKFQILKLIGLGVYTALIDDSISSEEFQSFINELTTLGSGSESESKVEITEDDLLNVFQYVTKKYLDNFIFKEDLEK